MFSPVAIFKVCFQELWNAGQASSLRWGSPCSGVWIAHNGAHTIGCTQPPPPRHTLCVPLALLERLSYANESCTRQTVSPSPFPLSPSLTFSLQTALDLSLCPWLCWAGQACKLRSWTAGQMVRTSLCWECCGHRGQTGQGSLALDTCQEKQLPHFHSSIGGFI